MSFATENNANDLIKDARTGQKILIATGASGGHVFPALAVADALRAKGCHPVFVGSGGKFLKMVEDAGYRVIDLPASPWNVANPLRKLKAMFNLVRAFCKSVKVLHDEKASAVFGTGGYATVAAVLAGKVSGVPTIIQEQNVLPGRANRLLSKWVDRVCLSFEASRHYLKYRDGVMVVTGNPVRAKVLEAQGRKRAEKAGHFNILVCGGSQGAHVLSAVVPDAINLLPNELRQHITVVQQVRAEDEQSVRDTYRDHAIDAEIKTFFDDIEQRMVDCHLMIARSGASTINEANLLGRAAIYVPLRLADGHQVQNARAVEQKGAAAMIEQADFTPQKLAQEIQDILMDADRLAQMEKASLAMAHKDAAQKVAAEVMEQAKKDIVHCR